MSPDDQFERLMTDEMSRAVAQFNPPPPDLALRGAARGRHQRRVRTVQLGAAALLAVTCTAFVGLGPLGGRARVPTGPATATPSRSAPASATPAPTPSATLSPLQVLVQLLGVRGTVSEVDADRHGARVLLDDGKGKALVEAMVDGDQSSAAAAVNCDVTPHDCEDETRPDGTLVKRFGLPPDDQGRGMMWSVDTLRPDGVRVVVNAFNATGYASPPTRSEPPLSLKELQIVALDPRWSSPGR